MIKCNLLKISSVCNFYNKKVSLISFGTVKCHLVIKTREIFNFLPVINNSDTIWSSFLLLSMSAITSLNTIYIFPFLFGLRSSIFL